MWSDNTHSSPRRRRDLAASFGSVLLLVCIATAGVRGQDCFGDCDGDGEVELGDVASAYKVYLGRSDAPFCTAADANEDGEISLGEVQMAFNSFLELC